MAAARSVVQWVIFTRLVRNEISACKPNEKLFLVLGSIYRPSCKQLPTQRKAGAFVLFTRCACTKPQHSLVWVLLHFTPSARAREHQFHFMMRDRRPNLQYWGTYRYNKRLFILVAYCHVHECSGYFKWCAFDLYASTTEGLNTSIQIIFFRSCFALWLDTRYWALIVTIRFCATNLWVWGGIFSLCCRVF